METVIITHPITDIGEFTCILKSEENKTWSYKIWSSTSKEDINKPDYHRGNVENIFDAVFYICHDIWYHFVLKNEKEIIDKIISEFYQKNTSYSGVLKTDWIKFVKDFKTKGCYPKELLTLYIKHCEDEAMFDKVEDNYSWAKRIVEGVKDFLVEYKDYSIRIIYNYCSDKFYYQIDDKKNGCIVINSFQKEEHTGANNALESAYKFIDLGDYNG